MPAVPSAVSGLRHRAADFATAAGVPEEVVDRVALAVSETVTNAILHARDGEQAEVRVTCRSEHLRLVVEVSDQGSGIQVREDSPGIGQGLAIVGALAQTLEIVTGAGGRGTVVRMSFGPAASPQAPAGLEGLCPLALDQVADVSCVDLVVEGVLRRAAAEVRGDHRLSDWLRSAAPPARPGTATWAALRESGARLVVHDPSVPRSPGGTGEYLSLTWWLAVPLQKPAGAPAALWGLGGREGGRPVPASQVIQLLAEAARGGLAQLAEQDLLRRRLDALRR